MDQALPTDQERLNRVFGDYLLMRRAAREENHILTLNRVGVEKDQKKIIQDVAKHVGLEMPKQFDDKK